jgi:hypothetical protein
VWNAAGCGGNERPRRCHTLDKGGWGAFLERSLNQDVGTIHHGRQILLPGEIFDTFRRPVD